MVNKNLGKEQIRNCAPFYIIPSIDNIHVNYGGCPISIEGNKNFKRHGLLLESLGDISKVMDKFLEANRKLEIENIIKNNWTYLICSEVGEVEKIRTYLGYASRLEEELKNTGEGVAFLKLSGRKSIDSQRGGVMDVNLIYSKEELSNENPHPKIVYSSAMGFC